MQEKLQEAQARLAETRSRAHSGGGMVTVTLKGSANSKAWSSTVSLLAPDEAEVLSDLIVAAHADAKRKLDVAQAEPMKTIAGPLAGMPGLPKF